MACDELPAVSVVTSVFNAGRHLRSSVDSILRQTGVDFEWILIDDGSTDGSSELLDEVARSDPRVRLVRQVNQGLTRSLILGCSLARGRYIARHDADDISLAGRLAGQARLLDEDVRLVFASCWTRVIGPGGEELYDLRLSPEPDAATRELREHEKSPAHGSVMMRRDAYLQAGGYRAAFRFAQDRDLWLRLSELGALGVVPQVLYEFRLGDASVTSSRRDQQRRLAQLANECLAARRSGSSEAPLLMMAEGVSGERPVAGPRASAADAYFVGKCLLDRRDSRALAYMWRSVRESPGTARYWVGMALAAMRCCAGGARGSGRARQAEE